MVRFNTIFFSYFRLIMVNNVYLEKYNSTLSELINEIKNINLTDYKEIISDEINLVDNNNVESYLDNCNNLADDFSTKNAIVFCKDIVIMDGINFYLLWNKDLSDVTRDNIWKYLFTLYLYGYTSKNDLNLGSVIKNYKNSNNIDINSPSDKILFAIIDNLNNEKRIKKLAKKEKETLKNTGSNCNGPFDLPLGDGILNGEIGKLAKEIANEINPSDFESELQNQNPQELLNNLFTGNIDQESPILNLVKTISTKIQSKVNDGGINENVLFQEAQSMLGNNNMFKDILGNNMPDISNPNSNIKPKRKNNIDKMDNRKKILREKLRKKKSSKPSNKNII